MGLRDLFSQWNTKTVGGISKLGIDDYSLIQDPGHLEFANAKDIDAINAVGQATNLQSQSGPIPDTQFVLETDGITNSHKTVYQPDAGQVYQLVAASIISLDGANNVILNIEDATTTTRVQIDTFNGTSNPMELNEPIFISNSAFLTTRTDTASSGNARLATSLIRVR